MLPDLRTSAREEGRSLNNAVESIFSPDDDLLVPVVTIYTCELKKSLIFSSKTIVINVEYQGFTRCRFTSKHKDHQTTFWFLKSRQTPPGWTNHLSRESCTTLYEREGWTLNDREFYKGVILLRPSETTLDVPNIFMSEKRGVLQTFVGTVGTESFLYGRKVK